MSRFSMLVILALSLAAVSGLAAFVWKYRRAAAPESAYVESSIGDVPILYAAAYARFPKGKAGGRLEKLDLAASIPEMRPAGDIVGALPAGGAPTVQNILFLTLSPEQRSIPPAMRVDALYSNFLEPEVEAQENGLILRRFQLGSPYEGEELFFDPPDGRNFAARCIQPSLAAAKLPLTCIGAQRLHGLEVDMRFGREALGHWRAIAIGAQNLVQSMLETTK